MRFWINVGRVKVAETGSPWSVRLKTTRRVVLLCSEKGSGSNLTKSYTYDASVYTSMNRHVYVLT